MRACQTTGCIGLSILHHFPVNTNGRGLFTASGSQIEKYISAMLHCKWDFYQYKKCIFLIYSHKCIQKIKKKLCLVKAVQREKIKITCSLKLQLGCTCTLRWIFTTPDALNKQLALSDLEIFIINFLCRDTDNNAVILSTFMRTTLSDNSRRDSSSKSAAVLRSRETI